MIACIPSRYVQSRVSAAAESAGRAGPNPLFRSNVTTITSFTLCQLTPSATAAVTYAPAWLAGACGVEAQVRAGSIMSRG
jgi:hypothetical protein